MKRISKRVQNSVCFVAMMGLGLAVVTGCAWESKKPSLGANLAYIHPNAEAMADYFEGESRDVYRHREAIVEALDLKAGQDAADVGAGTGFFSRLMAGKVGPAGKVYAVDIAQNFLDHITETCKEAGIENVEGVLCDQRSTKLAADSVDQVFICDTYHHFEHPADTLASIHQALRDGGTMVIVDFERIPGKTGLFILGHVRCGKETVIQEVEAAGFEFVEEVEMMEEQYVIRFRKGVDPKPFLENLDAKVERRKNKRG
jgi:predicted methyltransferase